ncbi:hypothetical protein [Robertmurraya siralis]|uniref:hypothetical protein n=1 Tax=Robertmurraya siralis TaxID=77777 RepID=UPI001476DB13|nr:hypothetical protein [Robertmurraya siralis]
MKVYTNLMKHNDVPMEAWSLYADVTCQDCEKVQTLANYRSNSSCCVKCGSKINV